MSVSSEGLGKLKDNEAYRKTTGIASAGWEKTSNVAAAGWEKTKQGASTASSSAKGTIEKVTSLNRLITHIKLIRDRLNRALQQASKRQR